MILIEVFFLNICFVFRSDQSPDVNVPYLVENHQHHATHGAKLTLTAILAICALGGLMCAIAVITTVVILVKRYVPWFYLIQQGRGVFL